MRIETECALESICLFVASSFTVLLTSTRLRAFLGQRAPLRQLFPMIIVGFQVNSAFGKDEPGRPYFHRSYYYILLVLGLAFPENPLHVVIMKMLVSCSRQQPAPRLADRFYNQ